MNVDMKCVDVNFEMVNHDGTPHTDAEVRVTIANTASSNPHLDWELVDGAGKKTINIYRSNARVDIEVRSPKDKTPKYYYYTSIDGGLDSDVGMKYVFGKC